jgi:hypothetical protein
MSAALDASKAGDFGLAWGNHRFFSSEGISGNRPSRAELAMEAMGGIGDSLRSTMTTSPSFNIEEIIKSGFRISPTVDLITPNVYSYKISTKRALHTFGMCGPFSTLHGPSQPNR